ncbi:MAG: glycerol-3-phosphate acyltransferase, partial [Steroidobacteraceae bacterium]
CGLAVIVGHVYPVWFSFRGGKGAATVVGVVAGLELRLLVPMLRISMPRKRPKIKLPSSVPSR